PLRACMQPPFNFHVQARPVAARPVIVCCPDNRGQHAIPPRRCSDLVSWTAPTVTDNCPNPTIQQTAGPASGSLLPPGVTTITYTSAEQRCLPPSRTLTVWGRPDAQRSGIVAGPANMGPSAMDCGACC